MQRFAEAEAVYTGLEQAFPGDAAIMNGKAVLLNRTGRTDAAINLWHNLQARHPDMSATFTINIGLAQRAPGQVVEAIARFRSEERRVGKECGSTCRSRGSPHH